MRIAVIGAGIVGTASAYELAADGHEVTVLERHSSIAAEASFAPAGLFGEGWFTAAPLAEGRPASLGWRQLGDAALWPWWWRQHRSLAMSGAAAALARRLQLARQGRERLDAIAAELGLEFERGKGVLLLWRSERERAAAQPALAALRDADAGAHEVDAATCRSLEPDLAPEQPLVGGLHLPRDGHGNCRQFAHGLREAAERRGVEFRFSTTVRAFEPSADGDPVQLLLEQMAPTTGFGSSRVARSKRVLPERARAAARFLDPVAHEGYDAVVVAAGGDATALLQPLGLKLPLRPVHGYSLTAALRSPERGPRSAVIDTRYGGVIGRLGQRVRVAVGAELGGSATRHDRAAVERLYTLLQDWYPGAAQLTRLQVWKGSRPSLPNGMPIVGPGPRPGIWLNLGHGGLGWSLACGSARQLADQIGGRTPPG